MSFLGEIKRRKIFQVAAVYAVVAWLIIQIIDVVNEPLNLPDWFDTVVIVLLLIGFPIAVVLAWAFELTPDGVVRDQGEARTPSRGGRKIEFALIGLLVLATGWIVYSDSNLFSPERDDVLPNSIAVLPFENLSLDPQDAFFAAGIHDTVLKELAKIHDMNVIARTSVLEFGDGETSIADIAEDLNVETVMDGSVQYADGQVLVTVQLIDPKNNTHLWAESYTREFSGIFEIQADIATQIAIALKAVLTPSEKQNIERPITDFPDAYVAFLKAIEPIPGFNDAGLGYLAPTVIPLLDRATELDPEFALAYAHKAKFKEMDIEYRRRNAQLAIDLDPDLGFAHLAQATVYVDTGDADNASESYRRALLLSPNDPEVLIQYAFFESMVGNTDHVTELVKRALNLDPGSPSVYLTVGMIHRLSGNVESAAQALRTAVELNPTNQASHSLLAYEERKLGNVLSAIEHARIAESLEPQEYVFVKARIAYLYHLLELQSDADRLLVEYRNLLPTRCRDIACEPGQVEAGEILASLAAGNPQLALESLERLVEIDSGLNFWSQGLKLNVAADPTLDLPEFRQLRARLGYKP